MNLVQKVSAYTLGLLTDKDLPDIAMTGLEEGYDSESLRILAGHNSSDNAFQLVDYFNKALSEIGLTRDAEKKSLVNVLKYYADKIIHGQIDPYFGFDEVDKIIRKTKFDYSDISLNTCYVDYISIWEVKGDGLQLHTGTGLTKEQYIDKTKKDLIIHLQQWATEIGGT
jgi:hypothetical protein